MNIDLQSFCSELINATLAGGAAGLIIVALVWTALRFLPRLNAATRHGAWFVTLLIITLLPAAILVRSLLEQLPEPAAIPLETEPALFTEALDAPGFGEVSTGPSVSASEALAPWQWSFTVPERLAFALVGGWVLLAAIRLANIAVQLWILRRTKQRAAMASPDIAIAFDQVVASTGLSREPRLLISDNAPAPMVVGYFRPAMLLPKGVLARSDARQLEHLFRHELAHLARRDDWTNLFQQAAAAIFFFHPGVLFVSRRLTAEREIACDDHAVAISRTPREYALFLTEFASQMKGRDFTAAPAAWSRNSQLKERIDMILNAKRNASPRVSRGGVGTVGAIALGLAITALVATPRFVVAAEEPAPAPEIAPVEVVVAAPAISLTPVEVTVAAVGNPPNPPTVALVAPVSPIAPVKPPRAIVAAAPAPEPGNRPKRRDSREDDDVENRLDRLERMVEQLVENRKPAPAPGGKGGSTTFNHNFDNHINAEVRREIEEAHRQAAHARREAERAVRQHQQNEIQTQTTARAVAVAGKQSLKARREALEAQRKHIEKELESIEKQMRKEEEAMRKKEAKGEDKDDKKSRDNADDEESSSEDKAKRQ